MPNCNAPHILACMTVWHSCAVMPLTSFPRPPKRRRRAGDSTDSETDEIQFILDEDVLAKWQGKFYDAKIVASTIDRFGNRKYVVRYVDDGMVKSLSGASLRKKNKGRRAVSCSADEEEFTFCFAGSKVNASLSLSFLITLHAAEHTVSLPLARALVTSWSCSRSR